MATKKVPFFLSSPDRDQCAGRMLSLAHTLTQEGYKGRHIKFGAITAAFEYAQAEEFNEYRNFLVYLQGMARDSLADLDACSDKYDEAEESRRASEYRDSL